MSEGLKIAVVLCFAGPRLRSDVHCSFGPRLSYIFSLKTSRPPSDFTGVGQNGERLDYTIVTLDVLQACDTCADMGMTCLSYTSPSPRDS